MTDRPTPHLPADLGPSTQSLSPEYWERLAQRVLDDAAEPLATYRGVRRGGGWERILARNAPWLIAAAAAAMLSLWTMLPAPDAPPPRWIERALAPDESAGALLSRPAPPRIEALMVQIAPEHLEETSP